MPGLRRNHQTEHERESTSWLAAPLAETSQNIDSGHLAHLNPIQHISRSKSGALTRFQRPDLVTYASKGSLTFP